MQEVVGVVTRGKLQKSKETFFIKFKKPDVLVLH
jgi:hypothetical protein